MSRLHLAVREQQLHRVSGMVRAQWVTSQLWGLYLFFSAEGGCSLDANTSHQTGPMHP